LTVTVRLAAALDLAALPELERDAQQRFADLGMRDLADGPVGSLTYLAAQQARGLVWVAGQPPVGFAVAGEEVAGALYLAELSVARAAGGQGIGRALVEAVVAEAAARGLGAVVLSTFADVPWNGPFYRRIGFEAIPDDEVAGDPALAHVRAEEAARGFDLSSRVLLRRRVG
jgi:GNAT superfamily N-acetyltransferase